MMADLHISCLPDSVLELIFLHVKKGKRKALPLVCKAWASTYISSRAMWSHLTLRLNRPLPAGRRVAVLEGLPAALRARRVALQNLTVTWDPAVGDRLSLGRLLESLQPLTALTSLSLTLSGSSGGALVAQHLQTLSTLTGLERLVIKSSRLQGSLEGLPPPGLASLSRLRKLAVLTLAPAAAGISRVGCLSGLTAFRLSVDASAAPELPPALAQLTGLRELHLYGHTPLSLGASCLGRLGSVTRLQVSGAKHTLRGLALMPSLKILSVPSTSTSEYRQVTPPDLEPEDLFSCAALEKAIFHDLNAAAFDCDLPPGALPRLTHLSVHGRQLPRAFCRICSLRCLGLQSSVPIVLPPQLSQLASSLQQLDLDGRLLGELPACITGLSSLIFLNLASNNLTSLQDGPYLDRLEMLVLNSNNFSTIPQVLVRATALACLDICANPDLELQVSDVHTVFMHLRRLNELYLRRPVAEAQAQKEWSSESMRAVISLCKQCPWVDVDV